MPEMVVVVGDKRRLYCIPEGKPIVIGRAEECDLVLPAAGVSRRHAVAMVKNGVCGITDLQSANGTFVNGRPIKSPVPLNLNDVVSISTFQLRFGLPDGTGLEHFVAKSKLRLPRAMTDRSVITRLLRSVERLPAPFRGKTTRLFRKNIPESGTAPDIAREVGRTAPPPMRRSSDPADQDTAYDLPPVSDDQTIRPTIILD